MTQPLRFLVLEGNAGRRSDLVAMVEQAGYRAVAVPDPPAASEAMNSGEFDFLLLDLGSAELDVARLRQAISADPEAVPESLESAERRHLAQVLHHTSGNKRKAAHLLGISRSTLLNKVRKYKLETR